MIKRKGEKIMGIISIVLNAIGVGIGALFLSIGPSVYDEINEVLKEEGETLPIETLQASVHAFGTQFMVVSAIAAVLSIVGVIFLKTDRRAVLSGILFLVSAVTLLIGTVGLAFVPMVLLFIIGLMSLIRKPNTDIHTSEYPS
ncbi:membrane protein [Bacillus safensis]|nr:membrane protein [Bacillus safensis]